MLAVTAGIVAHEERRAAWPLLNQPHTSQARRGRGSHVPVSDTMPCASPKGLASDGIVVVELFPSRHFSPRPGVRHHYGSVTNVPQGATWTRPSRARDSTASRSRSAN